MGPLLITKLYVPLTRPDRVIRPRLTERLDEGMTRKLTLISAPAGFGKTTLISEWASLSRAPTRDQRDFAYLSLDAGDNDPTRFFTYVVAALQTVQEQIGTTARAILTSTPAPGAAPASAIERVLTSLINDVAALDRTCVLILDDYHLIQDQTVHDALAFLLDHLPPTLHLVIATRADPSLPLARLRGRGQLTELRQADLRFTPDEAATFLQRVSGLDLSAEDIAALEERTEGWITGMQLAALSMRGREDVSGFVSAFAGSHRYVLDYLTEKVLRRQPHEIQSFLLQTSILQRLTGPLCDAVLRGSERASWRVGERASQRISESARERVSESASRRESEPAPSTVEGAESLSPAQTGEQQEDATSSIRPFAHSQAVLEHLEAANLFVVPLDDRRTWYRYHRLFADLLQARLGERHPDRVPELHRRASVWYEREDLLDDAIKHAIAGGDLARAAHIVEAHGRSLLLRGELTTLLRWIAALPPEMIWASARICVNHAWALLLTGQADVIETRLQQAEQMLQEAPDDPLLGDIAVIRAYRATQQGDVARAVELAHLALVRLPPTKQGERGVAFFVLGGAFMLKGDRAAAADALASIQTAQGRLRRAQATAEEAIGLATGADGRPLPIAAGAVSALAELACEWNALDDALAYARQSVELARLWGNSDTLGFSHLTLVEVLVAHGRLDEAGDALREAERLSQQMTMAPAFFSQLRATRARLWLAQGDLAAAASRAARRARCPIIPIN